MQILDVRKRLLAWAHSAPPETKRSYSIHGERNPRVTASQQWERDGVPRLAAARATLFDINRSQDVDPVAGVLLDVVQRDVDAIERVAARDRIMQALRARRATA